MGTAVEKELDIRAVVAENERLKKQLAAVPAQPVVVAPSFEMDGPVDPIKFARGKKCSHGHDDQWDESKVVFVMDHQAFALRCKAKGCDGMFHFIRPGSMKVMPAPNGWASDVGIEEYIEPNEEA